MFEYIAAIFYPTFLILFFFGVIIFVGTIFSYWWLVVYDKRSRTCPKCGTVGGGQLSDSYIVNSENHMDFKGMRPSRVTINTHEDHYQCEHCGHTWIKTAKETKRVGVKV